jgi:hypothetical protein
MWLVLMAAALALSLWAGPVAVGLAAGLNLGLGILVGGLVAATALAANAAIAFLLRLPVALKVALMAGVAVALLGCFFLGAHLVGWDRREEPAEPAPAAKPLPQTPPPLPGPTSPQPPGPPTDPPSKHPPSHIDLAYHTGMSRLEDGPAAVTALALLPLDVGVVVGYADGTTAVWPLDQPASMPPWVGPRGDGAVRRIQYDDTGTLVYLTCDNGLVASPLAMAPAAPLKIPGERPAVFTEPTRDRFAAVRGGKVCVRLIPTDAARKPPPAKAPERFALCVPKLEVLPSGMKPDYPVMEANPTFVAFHPGGKLLWGAADGAITAWPAAGTRPEVITREHKGAVRAWASNGTDFATGDDKGMIGYWPAKAAEPVMLWNSTFPVTHFAFASWGRDVAVADAAGGLSVWNPGAKRREFEVKRPAPVSVLSYGPSDDLLLLADGKGVEVWWIQALVKKSRETIPPR